jgi:hypothetical protein
LWIVAIEFEGVISSPNAAQAAQLFSCVPDMAQGPGGIDVSPFVQRNRRLLLAVIQV